MEEILFHEQLDLGGFEGMIVLLTTISHHSPSTHSSPASRRPLASLSSQSACACRPTQRTRQTLRAFPTRGMLSLLDFGFNDNRERSKLTYIASTEHSRTSSSAA